MFTIFLKILDIPSDPNEKMEFAYDEEWLAIIKSTNQHLSLTRQAAQLPPTETLKA
jgi:hypothetical protein